MRLACQRQKFRGNVCLPGTETRSDCRKWMHLTAWGGEEWGNLFIYDNNIYPNIRKKSPVFQQKIVLNYIQSKRKHQLFQTFESTLSRIITSDLTLLQEIFLLLQEI